MDEFPLFLPPPPAMEVHLLSRGRRGAGCHPAPSYRIRCIVHRCIAVTSVLHCHGAAVPPGSELKYSQPATPPKFEYFVFSEVTVFLRVEMLTWPDPPLA
jgi:hypothetical protein